MNAARRGTPTTKVYWALRVATNAWSSGNSTGAPTARRCWGQSACWQEQARADAVRQQDGQFSSDERAEAMHCRGVRIRWLLAFTFDHDCWDMPTWQVVRDIIVPATRDRRCRYAELPGMCDFTGPADVFMSHCWGARWGDLVCAACCGARADRIVWIDLFAVRQWPGNAADVDFRPVVARCKALIVAVSPIRQLARFLPTRSDHEAFLASPEAAEAKKRIAFFRLWCIVELAAAVDQRKPVVVKGGRALYDPETSTYAYDTAGMRDVLDNLTHMVDCEQSECYVADDKTRELATIRSMDGGTRRVDDVVIGVLEGAVHSVSLGLPQVDAFACGEPESFSSLASSSSARGRSAIA